MRFLKFIASLAISGAMFIGCTSDNTLAGIEIGNPEVAENESLALKADFSIDYVEVDRSLKSSKKALARVAPFAKEASKEFWTIYGAPVLCIPNHRKNKRKIFRLKTYSTKESKRRAIVNEVIRVHKIGRPILIGTKDIDESEILANMLAEENLKCRIINAVRSEDEANIVAEAGKYGAITVATNMAGRGTDIKIPDSVKKIGGLHVIATECNLSARIDRQLFGRSARQGDPGSASHYASFEDDVLRRNLPTALVPLCVHAGPCSSLAVKWAQHRAGKKSYQSRVSVQRTDTWLEESLGFSGGDV